MANPTCTWIGASGTKYTYSIHPRSEIFTADQAGNYIFSKKNESGQWVPVYIGEGDLGLRCGDGHHRIECINSKGATHVHAHLNNNEKARKTEESDLLGNYTNAYVPTGCNVKPGG